MLLCRQHRAALQIQAAWRGRLARRKFLATRRGIVALQVQSPTYATSLSPISSSRYPTSETPVLICISF